MFWLGIVMPVLMVVIGYAAYFERRKFEFSKLPTEYDRLTEYYPRLFGQIFNTIYMFIMINVYYHVRRTYVKATRSAAPLAKIHFAKYTNLIKYPVIINTIAGIARPFIPVPQYALFYYLDYFIYAVSLMCYIYCFNKMYVIKEGEIYPIGITMDILIIITYIVIAYCAKESFGKQNNNNYRFVYAIMEIFNFFFYILKHVMISLDVLENKFLRLPDALL
jgi:hypothetical protein